MVSNYRKAQWNETITVFHRNEVSSYGKIKIVYTKHIYTDCFWKENESYKLNGTTIAKAISYIVRIPSTNENVTVSAEDVVIRGDIPEEMEESGYISAIQKKYVGNCFVVSSVADNTKQPTTKHWKATG